MSELMRTPALELSSRVRAGEVSARELVEDSLAEIGATEELNHWTTVDADGALAAADAVQAGDERPFAGVPLALKDLFLPAAGLPLHNGSALLGDFTPDYDSAAVRRFREAGFVFVGRTQSPEFGITPVTQPRRYGPARNPWDPSRTTGGSSGGSAGAVAAGAVPIAHASDGGGSIRIPAACCGLVGLKPSRGRISWAPDLGDQFLSTNGAVTRTVADSAAVLDVLAGYETGDATWAPPPATPFAEQAAASPSGLRVALCLDRPIDCPLDPQCEQAARDTAKLLEGLGHHVEEVDAPWKGVDLAPPFTVLWAANVSATITQGQMLGGAEATPETIEPLSMWLYELGRSTPAPDYLVAVAMLQAFSRTVIGFMDSYDVILTPSLAQLPLHHDEVNPLADDPAHQFEKAGWFTPYTPPINVTGQPAISLPLHQSEEGLPLGSHLIGRPAEEGTLLAVGRQLEEAAPWASRTPGEAAH